MIADNLKQQVQIALVDVPEFIIISENSVGYTAYKKNPVYTVDCKLYYKEQLRKYDEQVAQDELEDTFNKIVFCASDIGLKVHTVIHKCIESKNWIMIKIKFI